MNRNTFVLKTRDKRVACPLVKRKTEGGRTFPVTASQVWNKSPLSMRKLGTLKAYKNSLWLEFVP